jgi:DNA-binding transcriptional ArsR family regulator
VAEMHYRSTIQTSFKILETLLVHGEYAQYDMPKAVGKDYRTVLRHIQSLENAKLITLVRLEPAQKKGKERKIYTVTLRGLLSYLTVVKLSVDKPLGFTVLFADKFKHVLPLVFGKWHFFASNNLDSVVSAGLSSFLDKPSTRGIVETWLFMLETPAPPKTAVDNFFVELERYTGKNMKNQLERAEEKFDVAVNKTLENELYRYVFITFPINSLAAEERVKFFRCLCGDTELRSHVIKELKLLEQQYMESLRNIQNLNHLFTS